MCIRDRDQFLDYCDKRGLASGHDVYKDVSSRLGPDHPLLTRAVLVRRLVDIADRVEDTAKLLDSLGDTPQDYFAHFVNAIIRREAYEKWIDRSGDPAKPLLSLDEHHLLLASIAQEMWHNSTNTLRQDLLEVVAELFCDSSGVSVAISRQVKDRIIHHPLLTMSEPGKPLYSFDHEEFRSFFLGEAVAGLLSRGELDALGSMLRKGVLPPASADAMAKHLRWRIKDVGGTVESLARLCVRDGPASFLRENCGALIIRLLDGAKTSPVEVRGVSFPADSLGERKIQAITFRDCYFQPTELKGSHLTGCTFINCSIERLDLCHDTSLTDTCMQNTEVKSITPPGADYIVFEPQSIQALLKGIGLPAGAPEESLREPQEPERELVLAERVLRAFRRATHINEHVLRVRLGRDANDFFDNILPRLLRAGVMEEVRYLGSGKQRRFRLSAHMDSILSLIHISEPTRPY